MPVKLRAPEWEGGGGGGTHPKTTSVITQQMKAHISPGIAGRQSSCEVHKLRVLC